MSGSENEEFEEDLLLDSDGSNYGDIDSSKELKKANFSVLTAFTIPLEVVNKPILYFNEKFSAGSMKGAVTTLLVSIVGAGTLSVPFAIEQSGLLVGCFLFVLGGMLAAFTLNLLTICSEISDERSYESIARHCFGHKFGSFVLINLCFNLYGTVVSYMIAAGHTLSMVLATILQTHDLWYVQQQWVIGFLLVFVILPLSLLPSLSALRYSSLLGMGFLLYLTAIVSYFYFQVCSLNSAVGLSNTSFTSQCFYDEKFNYDQSLFYSGNFGSTIAALPIVIYAYTCHPSLFPILIELKRPNLRRMGKVINRSVGVGLLVYLIIGTCVYLTFGADLEISKGNFLLNDFRNSFFILIGSAGMGCSICLTIPLLIATFRNTLAPVAMKQLDYRSYRRYLGSTDLTRSLLQDNDFEKTSERIAPIIPKKWFLLITVFFLVLCGYPAIFVDDITVVFTILGATTNPLLGFVFPCMMFLKLTQNPAAADDMVVSVTGFRIISVVVILLIPILSIASIYYKV
eukprot:snap_masked-scaffold_1-processed-gene-6.18-mRNA-1 protein AED:1.00 eAED:1.00 QI:0/0/0/0/1/1/2/0/513